MSEQLKPLELRALEIALSGNELWKAPLRQQVQHLRVTSRDYTGFGFYANFICTGGDPAIDLPPAGSPERVPVAWAAHPDVAKGGNGAICFNVFLKGGVIDVLEGASTTTWPETEDLITFIE